MTEWLDLLEAPLLPETFFHELPAFAIGKTIRRHDGAHPPDTADADIVIIGVPEDRNASGNQGSSLAPDKIREQLYRLMNRTTALKIADVGNIKPGNEPGDTYFVLSDILAGFITRKIFPVILGGSNDIAFANYLAYEKTKQIINIAAVDSMFDIGTPESPLNAQTYLNKIVMRQPNYLFNYTNIGYQSYLVDNDMLALMNKLFFDVYRVGMIRNDMEEAEPLLRNADMLSIDISAVRHGDAPANEHASPNGFYGEEICRICRYAGMSDKLTSAGIYEINPSFDLREQTTKLAAQMIWFLLEGFSLRKQDHPKPESEDFSKYHVFNSKIDRKILFYKSKKSGRWWMEVPCPVEKDTKFSRHYIIACSFTDYQTALKDELPDRWWQTYQKIM